jgi:hypothetical protein
MSSEVTVLSGGALARVPASQAQGVFTGDVEDILIPKILLGQSTSKAVQEGKVQMGQLYKSTTAKVLPKPVAVLPLYEFKTWIVSEKSGGRFQFRKVEPYTKDNATAEWAWQENGTEWKREKCLNFYVLLLDDVKEDYAARKEFMETGEIPDTEASLLPCVLSFKSTSFNAGRVLTTHFAKCADFGVKPYVSVMHLSSDKMQNDRGIFQTFTVANPKEKTPQEMFPTCDKWYAMVRGSNMKVDEENSDAAIEVGDDLSGARQF